jgi:hypothetical protein
MVHGEGAVPVPFGTTPLVLLPTTGGTGTDSTWSRHKATIAERMQANPIQGSTRMRNSRQCRAKVAGTAGKAARARVSFIPACPSPRFREGAAETLAPGPSEVTGATTDVEVTGSAEMAIGSQRCPGVAMASVNGRTRWRRRQRFATGSPGWRTRQGNW